MKICVRYRFERDSEWSKKITLDVVYFSSAPGLGRTYNSNYYGISNVEEAKGVSGQ